MRVHAGASASVGRDLYLASGGMPTDLVLGEDIVLGYRLREAGAVFVPDREARSLHLGRSTVMRGEEQVNRYNKPFLTDKVPEFRGHRLAFPRSYEVPYVEVVLPVGDASYETVRAAVDAQLASSVPDLVVSLVADWGSLSPGRRAVLADEQLDLRLVAAAYASEPRVRHVEAVPERCDATFRVTLPGPEVFPVGKALDRLLRAMEDEHTGTSVIAVGDGPDALVERTAARARARRLAPARGPADDLLGEVWPVSRTTAESAGFVAWEEAPRIKAVRGLVPWGVSPDPADLPPT
jgi:hypothetical protein